ncbi:hypothetical protein GSI_10550 [Ganoderma sinense ZZ0214-1]|uniref:G-patch domain-containing protein n=1 Tax=Ganoderma sinense ZZ0214-1 TaxID=1077348 RepID=A0A2G8S0V1_9APHY|nr:hypothetical protein GSI_10550 [Ganoderma sinense ZZ0214-1]
MGLSGRKTKQRIPNDPRNLAWANDANKFGAAYLAKFGWDPSGGLGVSGEGRTKALSVTQKLDMLGIGADHKNSAEGLAWKQNKDFESLLRRLNAANGDGEEEETRMKVDGFTKGADMSTLEDKATTAQGEGRDEAEGAEERKSKKKRKKDADAEEGEREKKFKKKRSSDHHSDSEGETKSKKRKSKKGETEVEAVAPAVPDSETFTPSSTPASRSVVPNRHPRAAFRARHMAAKSRASTSSAALAEILGIADSGSATPVTPSSVPTPYPPTPFEAGPSTSSSNPSGAATPATPAEEIKLQELTVSNKSVMDYFKEKLAAKSHPASSSGTPAPVEEENDYDQRPRMGLGASRLRQEISLDAEERRGLGGIGNGSRLSFASMFTSAAVPRSAEVVTGPETQPEVNEDADAASKKSKDKKDKERKKEQKSRKEKGKDKEVIEVESVEENRDAADEKAVRKRRKEEKRRRKEAEAQTSVADDVDGGDLPSSENMERRGKSKKRSKTDR